MEENTDSNRNTAPSIPANYVSILQLQQRRINEKERKQKEEEDEEKRRKQQAEEQQRVEEDLKKPEVKGTRRNQSDRKYWRKNVKEKKSVDGGEARCVEEEEPAAIGEDAAPRDEGLPKKKRRVRKRYTNRKKKNQDMAVVEDVVECGGSIASSVYIVTENNTPVKRSNKKKNKDVAVVEDVVACGGSIASSEYIVTENNTLVKRSNQKKNQDVVVVEDVVACGGSIAPPEYIVTENKTPVKDEIRFFRKKGEKTKGKKSVGYREKAVLDVMFIETQFEDLSIKRGEEKGETQNLKAQTRSSHRNQPNQRYGLPPRRVRMPIVDGTMVWVKKGQSERGGDGIGSGV